MLDSMDVWNEIDRIFLSRRGISVPEDYLQVVAPMGFRRAAESTVERFGLPESVDALIEEWDALAIEAYQTRVRLKPGAREYLFQLKRQEMCIRDRLNLKLSKTPLSVASFDKRDMS